MKCFRNISAPAVENIHIVASILEKNNHFYSGLAKGCNYDIRERISGLQSAAGAETFLP